MFSFSPAAVASVRPQNAARSAAFIHPWDFLAHTDFSSFAPRGFGDGTELNHISTPASTDKLLCISKVILPEQILFQRVPDFAEWNDIVSRASNSMDPLQTFDGTIQRVYSEWEINQWLRDLQRDNPRRWSTIKQLFSEIPLSPLGVVSEVKEIHVEFADFLYGPSGPIYPNDKVYSVTLCRKGVVEHMKNVFSHDIRPGMRVLSLFRRMPANTGDRPLLEFETAAYNTTNDIANPFLISREFWIYQCITCCITCSDSDVSQWTNFTEPETGFEDMAVFEIAIALTSAEQNELIKPPPVDEHHENFAYFSTADLAIRYNRAGSFRTLYGAPHFRATLLPGMSSPVYYCNINQDNMEEYYESLRLSKTIDPYVSSTLLRGAETLIEHVGEVGSREKTDAIVADDDDVEAAEDNRNGFDWNDRLHQLVQFTETQKSLNDDMDVDSESVATEVTRQRASELAKQGAQLLYEVLVSTIQEVDVQLSSTVIFDSASEICNIEKSLLDRQRAVFVAADPSVREQFQLGPSFQAFFYVYEQHVENLVQVMKANSTSNKPGWQSPAVQEMTKVILTKANLDHPKKLPCTWEQYATLYKPLVKALSRVTAPPKQGQLEMESMAQQTARLAQSNYHQQYSEWKKSLEELKTFVRNFMQQATWPLETEQRNNFLRTVSSALARLKSLRTELTTQEIQLRNMSRHVNWDSIQIIVDDGLKEDAWLQGGYMDEFVISRLSPQFEAWVYNAVRLFDVYSVVSSNPSELVRQLDAKLLDANMDTVYEQVASFDHTDLIEQIKSVLCEISPETGDWVIKMELSESPAPTTVMQLIGQFSLSIQGPPKSVESWKRLAEIVVRWPSIVYGCLLVPFYCRMLSRFQGQLRDQFPPNKNVSKKKSMQFMINSIQEMDNQLKQNNVEKLGIALIKAIQETFDAIDARKEGVSEKSVVASYKAAKEALLFIS